MVKKPGLKEVRIEATRYMDSCAKCGHSGLQHTKDKRDPSRQGRSLLPIVECTKCDCKKFVAPKK